MFKADISNCFNQLHWHPKTAKLMGFMLTHHPAHDNAHLRVRSSRDTHALNRKINRVAPSCTFTYVDDFFGAGTYNDTAQTQKIVHDTITNVLGPYSISVKKNIHS